MGTGSFEIPVPHFCMIVFDLDDTLLDHRGAQDKAALAWREALGARFVPQGEANFPEIWHSTTLRYWKLFERGEISFAEQSRRRIRDVLRDPHLPDQSADEYFARYVLLYEANWQLFPDVLPCLELLRGQELGILTNGDLKQQTRKLERFGLLNRFEVVLILDETGPRKPALEAFELTAQKAGVHAVECLYIGDQIENDALAARAAGWRGVWLERTGMMVAPNGIERITSLLDVPFLLK